MQPQAGEDPSLSASSFPCLRNWAPSTATELTGGVKVKEVRTCFVCLLGTGPDTGANSKYVEAASIIIPPTPPHLPITGLIVSGTKLYTQMCRPCFPRTPKFPPTLNYPHNSATTEHLPSSLPHPHTPSARLPPGVPRLGCQTHSISRTSSPRNRL